MSTPTQSLRSIYMFRMVNGQRVRWRFQVDSSMLIINEGPSDPADMAAKAAEQSKSSAVPASKVGAISPEEAKKLAMENYKRSLEARGIKYHQNDAGQIIIDQIPDMERQIMQFFNLQEPCPEVPGMEAIRENYKTEYNTLGGAACPACQLNTLQRKYRELIKTKLYK